MPCVFNSYMESDPVKIVVEGLERFEKMSQDLIVIDTSGRHKQEAGLFEEMQQLVQVAVNILFSHTFLVP